MKYCELCQAFYISTTVGGLEKITSQGSIAEYFIKLGLSDESEEAVMPTNPSSFDKWYSGRNGQQPKVWNAFKNDFKEKDYVGKLSAAFGEEVNVKKAAEKLGISVKKEKEIKRGRLAIAIARQMLAFAQGKGEAENIINDVYSVSEIQVDFSEYIQKATNRYNVMKLIGGNEVSLEDYFICNTLGERPRAVIDRTPSTGNKLENATIEGIRTYYEKRKFDNRLTILIGSGGSGKTLMLQHLFLDGVEKYPATGKLPIFLEMRYITQSDDIKSFIYKTVSSKDESFTDGIVEQLLLDGRCPILMDGLDEIDPSDINDFQLKLSVFVDKYPRTQIIIASRDCPAIRGLNGFTKFYVWPFDADQSVKLIDKILTANGTPEEKGDIVKYIDNGFIKKRGAFATHPMLITFVAMNYSKFDISDQSHLLFYRSAYQALLTGHDDNKKPYDRVFRSVDNSEQFSTVFREFCGETYRQGVLKFDDSSFDTHFKALVSYKGFENTSKMDAKSFRHDACATACMMYEKEPEVWYIDPGFQEFLFAEYYSQQEPKKVKELEETLRSLPLSIYGKLDAFDMLYNSSELKFKGCILQTFLDRIFSGKDEEEAFITFLAEGYDKFSYSLIDINTVEKYHSPRPLTLSCTVLEMRPSEERGNVEVMYRQPDIVSLNEPGTVILSYIYKLLDENEHFSLVVTDMTVYYEEFVNIVFTGEYREVEGLENELHLQRSLREQFDNKDSFEKTNDTSKMLRDSSGEIICFGYEHTIDSYDIEEDPEKFKNLICRMMQEGSDIYNKFLKVKDFHKKLKRELRKTNINY